MSRTTTTTLGLSLPVPGTAEPYAPATDNSNFQTIDSYAATTNAHLGGLDAATGYADTGWLTTGLVFDADWSSDNYLSRINPFRYRRQGDQVILEGYLARTNTFWGRGDQIVTLPAGFRPTAFVAFSGSLMASIQNTQPPSLNSAPSTMSVSTAGLITSAQAETGVGMYFNTRFYTT